MNCRKLIRINDKMNECHYFDPAFAVKVMTLKEDPLIDLLYTNANHWVIQSNECFQGYTETIHLINFLLNKAENEFLNRFLDDVSRLHNQSRAEYKAAYHKEPLFKQIEQKFKALANLKEELEEYRI